MSLSLAIFLLRPQAAPLGRCLHSCLSGVGSGTDTAAYAAAVEIISCWQNPKLSAKEQFAAEFSRYRQWVLVGTAGIAVRFLDGLIKDKKSDPAVVVLDEGGRYAIALLCGHEGGGNELAFRVANAVGAVPVITTATEAVKPLVVGIGCRKGVTAQTIEQAVLSALSGRAIDEIREVVTLELKASEPGLLEFCCSHNLPLRWFKQEDVAARPWVSEPSPWVRQHAGVDGVCEPCALMSSPRGRLIVPKSSRDGVAVAVVEDEMRLSL